MVKDGDKEHSTKEKNEELKSNEDERKEEDQMNPKIDDEKYEKCVVCEKDIIDDEERSVECDMCERWSHVKCVMKDEAFKFISDAEKDKNKKKMFKSGSVFYFCELCVALHKKKKEILQKEKTSKKNKSVQCSSSDDENLGQVTKDIAKQSKSVKIQTAPKSTEMSITSEDIMVNADTAPSSQTVDNTKNHVPLCSFYKTGKCRHGADGLRLYNGKTCSFSHPKKCIKYCRFGSDKIKGCDRSSCNLYHPTLCYHSVNHKKCFNPECVFTHLTGTVRQHPERIGNSFGQNIQYQPNDFRKLNYPKNMSYNRQSENYQKLAPSRSSLRETNMRQQKPFVYDQRDFPSLGSQQDRKLNELTTAVSNIQNCLNSIMKSNQFVSTGYSKPPKNFQTYQEEQQSQYKTSEVPQMKPQEYPYTPQQGLQPIPSQNPYYVHQNPVQVIEHTYEQQPQNFYNKPHYQYQAQDQTYQAKNYQINPQGAFQAQF